MKNKYFYPISKLKAKSWIRYWLLKKTEFKGKLSEILEGFSFTLNNTLAMKFNLFEIYGNSIQDGTPSPENEVPIKSAGENGSITEKIVNGNFANCDNMVTSSSNGIDYTIKKEKGLLKSINVNGTVVNYASILAGGTFILKAGTYKLYGNGISDDIVMQLLNPSLSELLYFVGKNDKEIIVTEDKKVLIRYRINVGASFNNIKLYPKIYLSTVTDDTYTPHEEQTYSIYTQQPFRSIGDVRDIFFKNTVDSPYYDENLIENGWYERHDIGELIIDENTSLNLETGDSFRLASSLTSNIVRPSSQAVVPALMTNYLQVITWGESWAGKTGFISGNSSTNDFRFRVNANMTLEELRTWLSTHNIKVNYIGIEPLNLPCTQSQIDILENIPSTFAGQTNVFSIDEVKAHLKIQYWESDTNG